MTEISSIESDTRPRLTRDSSFWGMTATQFLGAFNDNVFKQLVLLIGVDYVRFHQSSGDPYQTTAQAVFAIPFVLFSGFAGWLADRVSKRTVVVWAKVAEIVVMLAGMAAFLGGEMYSTSLMTALLIVLSLMSLQSAFFGPSKYGILPELFHEHDLPKANGIIQMTTFLAIIFGTAVCGAAKEYAEAGGLGLWTVSAGCVGIAVLGTLTSLVIRPTPVAEPGLRLTASSFGVDRGTIRMLRADRTILLVLLVSSLFWFLGGVVISTVNAFGKLQLGFSDLTTSLLVTAMGVGIAVGCALAGVLSPGRVDFGVVRGAAWGMCAGLLGLCAVPHLELDPRWAGALSGVLLGALGVTAGVFAVPLQVYLQARPPADQKGRMIGAMNLFNWIAILLAAGAYGICSSVFTLPPESPSAPPRSIISWTFAILAALVLPVALRFRPQNEELE